MITVKDLIEVLGQFPEEMEVRLCKQGYADVFHEIEHRGDVKPELSRRTDRKIYCVIHPKYNP